MKLATLGIGGHLTSKVRTDAEAAYEVAGKPRIDVSSEANTINWAMRDLLLNDIESDTPPELQEAAGAQQLDQAPPPPPRSALPPAAEQVPIPEAPPGAEYLEARFQSIQSRLTLIYEHFELSKSIL